jgi:hypothetical protein
MDVELDKYKDETTKQRKKFLAENPLPPNLAIDRMDIDEQHAPGWGDSRDADDGMAATKP